MVMIIADACVNWRNLSEADLLIKGAASAGADCIKFQAYTNDDIILHPRYQELKNILLKPEDIRYLYYRCQYHGVEFMCTPMYLGAVEMLEPYVKRWKVRFADRENAELIARLMTTDKEIIISSDHPRKTRHPVFQKIKKIYCIPEYPPKDYTNSSEFGGFDGYSCHIPDITHINMNPDILEVHVRLNKYDPAWEPLDQRVSIPMKELRKLCKEIK